MSRPDIQLPWHCHRTGDCCRATTWIVCTPAELAEVQAARPDVSVQVREDAPGLVAFRGGPCPYLDGATCTVHAVRPYNCRRFACYRVHPSTEPLEAGGPLGSWNTLVRVDASRAVRRDYAKRQRKAQGWARAHGWPEGGDDDL